MAEVETARIRTEQRGDATLEVCLLGAFTFDAPVPPQAVDVQEMPESVRRLVLKDEGITAWDSALLILLMKIKRRCEELGVELDLAGLPKGAQQMVQLASAVPAQKRAAQGKRDSFLARVGKKSQTAWDEMMGFVTFLGDATVSGGRMLTGRAQFRRSDLWAIIQECGPRALGIVTVISVLVGAILAFVGAMQLQMFGAQILVANLVGMGMVIEMGALMTGIILAGRTGAAFAAQIGTMQVNEEVEAELLETLAEAKRLMSDQSPVRYELNMTLDRIGGAADSIRQFIDYLQRHPEAFLAGKGTMKNDRSDP